MPSVLWHCWLRGRNGIWPVTKWGDGGGGHWLVWMEWRPAGWSVCLPLLMFPCTIKSRSSTLAPAHPVPEKGSKTVVVVVWCIQQTTALTASSMKLSSLLSFTWRSSSFFTEDKSMLCVITLCRLAPIIFGGSSSPVIITSALLHQHQSHSLETKNIYLDCDKPQFCLPAFCSGVIPDWAGSPRREVRVLG